MIVDVDRLTGPVPFQTAWRTVAERDVAVFAALTGDRHPVHVDPEWAQHSPFGGCIAHGALVLTLAVALLPIDPARCAGLRRLDSVAFKAPVRLGERIRVRGRLAPAVRDGAETRAVDLTASVLTGGGQVAARLQGQLTLRSALDADPPLTAEDLVIPI